jgi:two-component system, NtrC family, response regulator GlrR
MKRLFIVDDQADIREALCDLLADAGYAVSSASNARVALREIEQAPPDLVLTDYMMPVMDGLAFAAELRARHPALPIVLITAIGRDSLPKVMPGITEVMHKPFDYDVLMSTVERYAPV